MLIKLELLTYWIFKHLMDDSKPSQLNVYESPRLFLSPLFPTKPIPTHKAETLSPLPRETQDELIKDQEHAPCFCKIQRHVYHEFENLVL